MQPTNNHTGRSMVELRTRLINAIPELTDEWTNYNESDLGIAFIELMTGVADMLGFYFDKQTLETYLQTVTQRKNAKAILNTMNYKLHMKRSNVTNALISVNEPLDENLILPRYTQLSIKEKSEPLYYATTSEVVLRRGETSVEVPIIQGRHYTSKMTVKSLDSKLYIGTDDVAEGSVKLYIDGEEWREVPDVIIDDSGDKIFSVFENKDDKAYIQLPLDYKRLIPTKADSPVEIEYLQTLGAGGVIKSGTILSVASNIIANGIGINNKLVVKTLDLSSGGCDRESIEKARVQAPREWRTMNYAVTLEDFDILANGYAGVSKAVAVDWNTEDGAYVNVPYLVKVFVLPESYDDTISETVSARFIEEMQDYLKSKKLISTIVEVEEPDFVPMDISINVYHRYSEGVTNSTKDAIIDRIKQFTKPENLTFGRGVKYSNIVTTLESEFNLIRYVELQSVSSVSLKLNQLPRWRNIEVNMVRSNY